MSDQHQDKDRYKDTVFLPKTDFPMRGGLPQKEPEILRKWQETGLYDQIRARAGDKPKWILHDGPPYANGDIHMGHALNKILKDVTVKCKTMTGYDAPYVPGWDCHGLPIEWKVEETYRKAGKDKDAVDILEFREECRRFAQGWVDTQSGQFQRLGVSGDWTHPYRTMTHRAESLITREIHKFARSKNGKGGGLYKGLRPVMWSTVEKTALAEAEVEYKEHKSVTVWVKFPVVKPSHSLLEGAEIVIWTTTPWTLPSNRAVAFGEGIEYGVYEADGRKLCVAVSLADSVKQAAKIEDWELLGTLKGSEIAGTVCAHPLHGQGYDFDVPALAGGFVTEEAGTGFVHIAPGHGEDDFYLGMAHGVEVTDNVTDDGRFRPHVPLFAGLEVYTQDGKMGEGNFAVLRELDKAGKLLAKGSVRHDYPHSWRSKAPVIFRTTPQWFIGMDGEGKIREKALASIKQTKWIPAKGETRIASMIEKRPDWCISRQRAWGVPIALFVHKDTGEMLRDEAVFARIAEAFEEEGADAWWKDGAAQRFLGNDHNADDYDQIFDIVDVWFESGSTHAFVVGDTSTWPCFEGVDQIDLYLEGSDQHRGWFHSSLLESCGTRGRAPYKAVLTHGFVLDEKGYKMSKSLGNVVDPLKMMEQYGADIIRLWALSSDYAEDIRIGKDTLKTTGDLYRRIRNTLRFLLGALDGFTAADCVLCHSDRKPGKAPAEAEESSIVKNAQRSLDCARDDIEKLPELERLMLHRLHEMDKAIRAAIEGFEFMKLTRMLHDFCNADLSAFYFDIRKDRLYCDALDSFERRACLSVMAEIFSCLSAWLAPVLCFTAEEAWNHRPARLFEDVESVHLRAFPALPEDWHDQSLATKWDYVKSMRSEVLAKIEPLRANKTLGSSLEALPVITAENADILDSVNMADICISSDIKISKGGQSVTIEKAPGDKCERCWKVLPEVAGNEGLCDRCADVVKRARAA